MSLGVAVVVRPLQETVGGRLQPDLLLYPQRLADGLILDRAQILQLQASGGGSPERAAAYGCAAACGGAAGCRHDRRGTAEWYERSLFAVRSARLPGSCRGYRIVPGLTVDAAQINVTGTSQEIPTPMTAAFRSGRRPQPRPATATRPATAAAPNSRSPQQWQPPTVAAPNGCSPLRRMGARSPSCGDARKWRHPLGPCPYPSDDAPLR